MPFLKRYGLFLLKFVALLFGISLFIRLVSNADYGRVSALIAHSSWYLLLVLVPYFITSIFDTLGWRSTFPHIGREVSFSKLLSVKLMSEALLMSLPGGTALAESLKPLILYRRCGVPISEGIATGMMRNSFLSVGHAIYVVVSVALGYDALSQGSETIIGMPGLPFVILGASITVLSLFGTAVAILLYGSLAEKLHRALLRVPFKSMRKWLIEQEAKILDIDHQFSKFRQLSLRSVTGSVLLFVVAWFFETVETFLIMKLLGIELGFVEILALESALSFLRSIIVFLPAGIGIQDYGYVAFLEGFGVAESATLGAAFVLIKRSKEVFWILVGYILLAFSDLKPKEVFAQATETLNKP
ncbi:MAG: lysylphosphatidylglycerol synthase transmembrane domain-containing protein [Chloroherpetonaceae bacterium]|nr:flippase-like domain-containing protein [Chloroherpetonaceae bacterium]MCS7210846.1 flippase-like domain-containing protein [Chloroherpetonaceae bacterium]MDW8018467.1 lysylphosphatidylglycerol synthase transmembrane domain-containing protein [Chloroherpetonaceae bacterium]MDW8466398.1 lysylphosphatidylglycerol synthase transmembrane domain-containing protein [Chloroherpetonaceae bacterium]